MGVVSLNLPQMGIITKGDEEAFWELFDKRLQLCKEALMCRYELLKGTEFENNNRKTCSTRINTN